VTFLFTVPGQPVPKGRPRFTGKHTFTPKRTRVYESEVKTEAQTELRKWRSQNQCGWSTANRFGLTLHLYFSDRRKRDLDNCAKAITDALNGVVYDDDAQIDELHVYREFDKEWPRAVVYVRVL